MVLETVGEAATLTSAADPLPPALISVARCMAQPTDPPEKGGMPREISPRLQRRQTTDAPGNPQSLCGKPSPLGGEVSSVILQEVTSGVPALLAYCDVRSSAVGSLSEVSATRRRWPLDHGYSFNTVVAYSLWAACLWPPLHTLNDASLCGRLNAGCPPPEQERGFGNCVPSSNMRPLSPSVGPCMNAHPGKPTLKLVVPAMLSAENPEGLSTRPTQDRVTFCDGAELTRRAFSGSGRKGPGHQRANSRLVLKILRSRKTSIGSSPVPLPRVGEGKPFKPIRDDKPLPTAFQQ